MSNIRIALLHLLLSNGDVTYNRALIEKAIKKAGEKNVDWIVTPELATSGLQFTEKIGIDWIEEQPDEWMNRLRHTARSLRTTLFIGCPSKEENTLYNSVFVINQQGEFIGKQHKIARVDNWSSSGKYIEPIDVDGIKVGLLICADSYTNKVANELVSKGAEIFVAPSAWGPGLHGPEGEWEQRTVDTGLPMFVCNRTGEDTTVSFWKAESLVIKDGKRLLSHTSERSAILIFDWDMERMNVNFPHFDIIYL